MATVKMKGIILGPNHLFWKVEMTKPKKANSVLVLRVGDFRDRFVKKKNRVIRDSGDLKYVRKH